MKRISILLFLLTAFVFAKAQNPIPADSAFPIKQSIANAPNTIGVSNVLQGKGGFVNGKFLDTTAANRTRIKFYPGAQIFTTVDSSLWLRNANANAWIKSSSTAGNGDIYNINDSTIVICPVSGACDTIHLNNSNTYYFFFSGDTTYLVTCDTVQTICVGDSCYQQQVCDTIALNAPPAITVYQNGLWKSNNTVEFGDLGGGQASLIHNTVLNAYAYNLLIKGQSVGLEPLSIQLNQIPDLNTSLQSWLHSDGYQNTVRIRMNYTNPFYADTIGYMYNRIGYPLMTNSTGSNYHYELDNIYAKQVGILFHTLDTAYTDAVTIFGNQVPAQYCLTCNPQTDTTLYDSRIAIFKTDKNVQFPGYPNTRNDGVANKAIIPLDTDGNLGVGSVIASTSIVEIISDTSFRVCDLNGVCDTFIVDITNPTVINVFNDTTIIICNEAGSCDTITVNNYTITNGQVINVGNTLFVSKAGNDATGQRQRVDLHFLTIKAALAAAFTGDVIVVFPGTYEETAPINLAKSVNYHFIGKGDLRLSTSVANGAIFTDSTTVCYSKIWGEHWTFTARSSQKVLYQTGASTVEMVADSITSASGSTINTSSTSNARTKITANYMYANSFLGNLWIQGRNFYGDIDFIEAGEFGVPVWINNCASFVLHSKKIFSQNPLHAEYIIEVGSSTATDSIYIDADEIYAQLEWAVWAQGLSPNIYINAQRISANSDCVVVSSDLGMLTVKADVIEDRATGTIDGVVHGEGGNLTVINARITNASASGADVLTRNLGGQDGTVKLNSVVYNKTKVTEVSPGTIKRIDSLYYGSNFQIQNGRHETDTAIIVAANNLTLGRGNVQLVSGATQITAITTAGWQAGSSSVFLVFSGAPLVKNNTAGGAGTATIILAGATDFQAAANDVLELLFDGSNWREASRALAAGGGGVTADDGLTTNTATNVRLFGTVGTPATLLDDRYLSQGAFKLLHTGDLADFLVDIQNVNGSGRGLYAYGESVALAGQTINGTGVQGTALGGYGVLGSVGDVGIAVYGTSTNATNVGLAGRFDVTDNTTNNTPPIVEIVRTNSSGTPAAGYGGSIDLKARTSTGSLQIANQLIYQWTEATHATRKSQMDFTGIYNGTPATIMSVYGSGVVGIGISSSYTATRLNVVDNAVGAANIVNVTSTSTAAASDLQKGINVSLSGANANNDQDTYGIYSINTHTGGGFTRNYAVFGAASGATVNTGVYGEGSNGVWGQGTSYGVLGIGITGGVGGVFQAVDVTALAAEAQYATTNAVEAVFDVTRATTGAAGAAGIGGAIRFYNYNTTPTGILANRLISKWTTATATSETSQFIIEGKTAGAAQDWLTLGQSGYMKLRGMNVTEAGAITAADGMILYITNTDATFTSVGFWGRENGVWVKL